MRRRRHTRRHRDALHGDGRGLAARPADGDGGLHGDGRGNGTFDDGDRLLRDGYPFRLDGPGALGARDRDGLVRLRRRRHDPLGDLRLLGGLPRDHLGLGLRRGGRRRLGGPRRRQRRRETRRRRREDLRLGLLRGPLRNLGRLDCRRPLRELWVIHHRRLLGEHRLLG
jgi:hypothetical protein